MDALRRFGLIQLVGHGGITTAAALATFLATPVLVRLLGLDEFGRWSLVEPVIAVLAITALLGIEHGALKLIAHDGLSPRRAIGDLLPPGLLTTIPIGAASALVVRIGSWTAGFLIALLVIAEAWLILLVTALRAAERLRAYALGQVGRTALFLLVLCLALVAGWPRIATVVDVVVVRGLIAGALVVLLLAIVRPTVSLNLDRYGDAVRYGGFILLNGLLGQVLENFDRYFLAWSVEPTTVGAYVVHVKLTAFVGQGIMMPFALWFPVQRFRHIKDRDGGSTFFAAAALILLVAAVVVAGVVWLAGGWLIGWIAPDADYARLPLLLLLIAAVIAAMHYPLNIGLLKPGLTHRNIYPTIVGILVALVLARLLTPIYGLAGAAAAKAIALLASLVVLTVLSQRAHRVDYDYRRLAAVVAGAVALLLALELGIQASDTAALLVKVGLYLLGMALVVAGIFSDLPRTIGLVSGPRARPAGGGGAIDGSGSRH